MDPVTTQVSKIIGDVDSEVDDDYDVVNDEIGEGLGSYPEEEAAKVF